MYDLENYIPALGGFLLITILLILIPILVIYIIGLVKLYQKAGKQGWEAIIPFYSSWILTEIAELNWWWFLFLIAPTIAGIIDKDLSKIAPLISLFGRFCCFYNISKKLNKDISIAILTTIFPVIMIPIIGLSNDYQFDQSVIVSPNGPFENNNNNKETTTSTKKTEDTNKKFCPKCGKEIKDTFKFCDNCGEKLK